MIRLFDDTDHAMLYRKFHPKIPQVAVSAIMSYREEKSQGPHRTAIDVGCGSGQSTPLFSPYFKDVIGYDISEMQVQAAFTAPGLPQNVSYAVAQAESLPLPDNSVELVIGCTSFHWLDLPKFYAEVDRILVPSGVVAALGHAGFCVSHPTKSQELNSLMDTLVGTHLQGRYHEKLELLSARYQTLPMPYIDAIRSEYLEVDWPDRTVADVVGWYKSWSCYQTLYVEDPQKAVHILDEFQKKFMDILEVDTPPEETPITPLCDYFLVMCRKPDL